MTAYSRAFRSGVDPEKRGKFLGMVQSGTKFQGRATGLDHLRDLGITHVQIMPIFDFKSCSARDPNRNGPNCYNWGYDPENFNVPEERYSVSNDPVERIRELKTMINELHKAGIRVIMDVVYNHTAAFGDGGETTFSQITPQYFTISDLSGTGNSIDASKPMVSRFIRDSLEFWVREYHVDGFRFDLLGVFDYESAGDWGRYLNQHFPDAAQCTEQAVKLLSGVPEGGIRDWPMHASCPPVDAEPFSRRIKRRTGLRRS